MHAAFLLAASLLVQDDRGEPLYKFKTGTAWVFDGSAVGKGPKMSKMELSVAGESGGKIDVDSRKFQGEGGPKSDVLRWRVDEGMLIWAEVHGGAEKRPVRILRLGSAKGDAWEWSDGETYKFKGTNLGAEEVKVPAGTYKDAIHTRVELQLLQGGQEKFSMEFWLAPGVGPVKMVAGDERGSVTLDLKEFKPAK